MKVFVPFFEDALGESALQGASVVPFDHGYTLLHIERAGADEPPPGIGSAQIIRPEDWPDAMRDRSTPH